jgi:hypothetical protein
VFPQHALSFALRVIMMNPGLIPHGDEIQEVLTLVVIMFQLMAATSIHSTYALPSTAWAPILHKLCGIQACHTLLNILTLG